MPQTDRACLSPGGEERKLFPPSQSIQILSTLFSFSLCHLPVDLPFGQDSLVSKRGTIARRYLSTWFVPDVLGTVPLASLTKVFIKTVASNSSSWQGVKLIR